MKNKISKREQEQALLASYIVKDLGDHPQLIEAIDAALGASSDDATSNAARKVTQDSAWKLWMTATVEASEAKLTDIQLTAAIANRTESLDIDPASVKVYASRVGQLLPILAASDFDGIVKKALADKKTGVLREMANAPATWTRAEAGKIIKLVANRDPSLQDKIMECLADIRTATKEAFQVSKDDAKGLGLSGKAIDKEREKRATAVLKELKDVLAIIKEMRKTFDNECLVARVEHIKALREETQASAKLDEIEDTEADEPQAANG